MISEADDFEKWSIVAAIFFLFTDSGEFMTVKIRALAASAAIAAADLAGAGATVADALVDAGTDFALDDNGISAGPYVAS